MKIKRILVFSLLFVMISGFSASAGPTNYTYNYDFWGEEVASPDAYRASEAFLGSSLGISNFSDPQGLYIRDNRIYICDSGNNRIVLVEFTESGEYVLKKVISSVIIDGDESALNYPMDLFETESGLIYIADTNNQRILVLDTDFNYIRMILKPDDLSIGTNTEFFPCKLVVDNAERIYVQARNINKGLLEFDSTGTFTSYLGANKVSVSMIDYLWKTYIATDEQRSRMELFVPTEYNNVSIDYDGFIYTTTSTFNEELIETADPVRRLNAMGTDILVRNGWVAPIGDWHWGDVAGINGSSRFSDVAGFDNDSYICLDRIRGRLFMYDFQGNLLYAFGGVGNKTGYFNNPIAIDTMGYTLFVLDSKNANVTRLEMTEYGLRIKQAMDLYKQGLYNESSEMWDEVLKLNGNYDLAYIGKGRASLRNGEYEEAMKFYSLKYDATNYGKAFTLYRKQWMEENIVTIIIVLVCIFVGYKIIRFINKIRSYGKAGVSK